MSPAEKVIRTEIERRERELTSLRLALVALTGGRSGTATVRFPGKGTRRPKTAAEKKFLSAKLKAAWKRRKAAEKKAA